MNDLLQRGEIELLEKGDANNPVYLLGPNARFYNTEYKIMENNSDLLDCYKASLNGRTELVYITENLVPLSVVLPQLTEDSFLILAIKLCEAIKGIAENGFLNWQHIDFSKDRIFYQPADKSLHLVYLPVEGVYISPGFMDKETRSFISSLTRETRDPDSQKMAVLRSHVHTVEESLQEFIGNLSKLLRTKVLIVEESHGVRLLLHNNDLNHTITVDKPEFTIGKKAAVVDGLITYSKFVGRVHCRIVKREKEFYVYDLESKNGTFVNNKIVEPENGVLLRDGDRLKIADVVFSVEYKEV